MQKISIFIICNTQYTMQYESSREIFLNCSIYELWENVCVCVRACVGRVFECVLTDLQSLWASQAFQVGVCVYVCDVGSSPSRPLLNWCSADSYDNHNWRAGLWMEAITAAVWTSYQSCATLIASAVWSGEGADPHGDCKELHIHIHWNMYQHTYQQ